MIKDRLLLIEKDLSKQIELCAQLYKQMCITGNFTGTANLQYQLEREKLANLQYDLEIVKEIINKENHET